MKLTKLDKQCFVTAVMDDVPKIDYNDPATKLVTEDVIARLPQEVRALWDSNTLRGFVKCDKYINFPWPLSYVYLPEADGELSQATQTALEDYSLEARAQNERLEELKSKITAAIGACTTLKRAKEILPEFEKYLPEDRETTGVSNLPAIANLVTDLMHLGWPKNKEQPA